MSNITAVLYPSLPLPKPSDSCRPPRLLFLHHPPPWPPSQAMGLLFVPRPDLMLAEEAVMPILEAALEPALSAPHPSSSSITPRPSRCLRTPDHDAIKRRVLGNLVELLRAEEEGMAERQAQVREGVPQLILGSDLRP